MFKYQQENDIPLFYDPFSQASSKASLAKHRLAPPNRQRSKPGDAQRKIRIEQVIEDLVRLKLNGWQP